MNSTPNRIGGKMKVLTQARLRQLLQYDSATGKFTRLVRVGNRPAGEEAGGVGSRPEDRYIRIGIDGVVYYAHQLAWLYVHGVWPSGVIDHINGVSTDNRLANLRDVTAFENNQNQRISHKDSSGRLLGASWVKAKAKWRASITVDKRPRYLGYFDTQEQAHAAYVEAKRRLHPGGTL